MISAEDLKRTQNVWAERSFIPVGEAVEAETQRMLAEAPLAEPARASAKNAIVKMIGSYAAADWDAFQAARIPLAGYEIGPDVIEGLQAHAPEAYRSSPPLEMYRAWWKQTFATNSLFTSVSLPTNAITAMTIPLQESEQISFPEFTEKANQNWLSASPPLVFNYNKHILSSLRPDANVQMLRIFFFGKRGDDEGARPFMFTMLWDEKHSVWLPWRFTHASAKPTVHKIRFF